MAALSNYLCNKLTDHCFRGIAFAAPTTLYLALYTSNPGAGDTGTEVSATGYARQSLSASASNWKGTGGETSGPSAGTTKGTKNGAVVTFPAITAGGPVVVTHWAIRDAASGGNLHEFGALTVAKTLNVGDPGASIPVDALSIAFDS